MSRIHDILNKAERDGTARRVRGGAALEALDLPPAHAPAPEPVVVSALREVTASPPAALPAEPDERAPPTAFDSLLLSPLQAAVETAPPATKASDAVMRLNVLLL